MDRIRAGDIDMAYDILGEGPPLVMIQGLTATMDWWDPEALVALARRFKVLIFDNRGAGRTEAPPGEFSIRQFADDTAALMDALGIERAHVLGYSMGGMIAQELALRHPEKVDRLVLCATFCGGRNQVFADREVLMTLADRSGTPEELVERFMGLMFSPEWISENRHLMDDFKARYLIAPTSDHNATRQFMATVKMDTYDRLCDIEAPTLVLCGSSDVLIPPENSLMIAAGIPGARLEEYEGSGHGFFWQERQRVLAELFDFLS